MPEAQGSGGGSAAYLGLEDRAYRRFGLVAAVNKITDIQLSVIYLRQIGTDAIAGNNAGAGVGVILVERRGRGIAASGNLRLRPLLDEGVIPALANLLGGGNPSHKAGIPE